MKYKRIVVLTGAGISAESGIQTFRDSNGLWENYKTEDVATPQGYKRNKPLVLDFYNTRTETALQAEPNAAHIALAEFEQQYEGHLLIVTQNVDLLHEKAGSKNVLHMHGQLAKARCEITGEIWDCHPIKVDTICPCCHIEGSARPHVVFFEEQPIDQNIIERAVELCDLFVSIGTSGNVYPASRYVNLARRTKSETVELNLEKSLINHSFDKSVQGLASEIVPQFFDEVLKICTE